MIVIVVIPFVVVIILRVDVIIIVLSVISFLSSLYHHSQLYIMLKSYSLSWGY